MATKGRPTLYKGIRMRSRLEADYAAHMDRNGEEWEYEPACFAGPSGQWLPDFRVTSIYIELKPSALLRQSSADGIGKILRTMAVAWLSEPECPLRLQFWDWGARWGAAIEADRQGAPWRYVPAADLAAEQRVLLGMMLFYERVPAAGLEESDFSRPAHRLIQQTALSLTSAGVEPNPAAIAEDLMRQGRLRDIGGVAYLHELLSGDPPERFDYNPDMQHLRQLAADGDATRPTWMSEHPEAS